jgi:hypothetical protein
MDDTKRVLRVVDWFFITFRAEPARSPNQSGIVKGLAPRQQYTFSQVEVGKQESDV